MKVSSKHILQKITWRSLKAGRFRNIIAILAISLTAVMFTSVATLGSALLQSVEESTFRQVGTSSHGGFKYLTQEQYDNISKSPLIKAIDYDIILGFALNPELSKKQHELRYAGDNKARWGFSYPDIGTMPKDYHDIVLADTTLDLLGLPHELGQNIHLDFSMGKKIISDDFTLVGIYQGDDVMWASQVYLSHDYVRDLAPSPEVADPMHIAGLINADVWLNNSVNVEGKLNDILIERGYAPEDMYTAVNWAYTNSGELDYTSIFLAVTMLIIIAASGYLIIYSIFAISVSGDIRFYGLLKTIGTTGRQIKGIVRRQALILSAIGIPLGLILGFFLGTRLAPTLMGMMSYELTDSISANPWIFMIAAVFSLITVFVSCRKPGNMAAHVSPIEALRYTEGGTKISKRKGRKVTPFSMAAANIGRSRRKLITVLLSLSLSLILLNSIVSIVNGFDMDTYLQNQLLSDFYFTDGSLYNHAISINDKDFQGIGQELIDEVSAKNDVESYGRVFFLDTIVRINDEARLSRMDEIIRPYTSEHNYGEDVLDSAISDRYGILQIYGLDKMGFEKISKNYQNIDWEKFSSGKYVLLNTFNGENRNDQALYRIGEKIPIEAADGSIVEYEVLGYIDYPSAMSSQYSNLIGFPIVISSDEFQKLFPDHSPMSLMMDVDSTTESELEAWADELTSGRMSELTYRSKAFYKAEFDALKNTFLILGGALSAILALIGILNFINTMATSIMTRSRELAMLQSVGMTGKQLKQMLFGEGLGYAVLTLLFTLTFGSVISALLTNGIANQIWFFSYHFSLMPVLICTPILLVMCALVPLICAEILQKKSIVERLRESE